MGTVGKTLLIALAVVVLFAFVFGVCGGRLSKRSSDTQTPQPIERKV